MGETKHKIPPNKILLAIIVVLVVVILLLLGWRISKVTLPFIELLPPETAASIPSSHSAIKKNLSVPADSGWVATGLIFAVGQTISIKAAGLVDYSGNDPNDGEANPDGDGSSCDKASIEDQINQKLDIECLVSGVSWGMLVGKIGNGPPFAIGSDYQFRTNTSGELFLGVNDCCSLSDNTGEYEVTITSP